MQRLQQSTSTTMSGTFSRFSSSLTETGQQAARAAQGVSGFTNAVQRSTQGLGGIRTAVSSFAFEAAGLPGLLGRISSNALLFAGGSPLVLGVTGGLAAIAGAWRLVTRDAREAAEAQEEAGDKLTKMVGDLVPATQAWVEAQRELTEAEEKLEKIRVKARGEVANESNQRTRMIRPGAGMVRDETREALQAQQKAVDRLQLVVDRLRAGARDEHFESMPDADMSPTARTEAQRFARARAFIGQFGPLRVDEPDVRLRPAPRLLGRAEAPGAEDRLRESAALLQRLETPTERFTRQVELLRDTLGEDTPEFAAAVARLREELAKATDNALPRLGAAAINTFVSLAQGLQTGTFGGFLTTVGGIVSTGIKGVFTANPMAGAFLAGAGALAGNSRRGVRIDEYGAVAMSQMRQSQARPESFTLVLVADTGEEIDRMQYDLGRAQRRDHVVRLPRRFGRLG